MSVQGPANNWCSQGFVKPGRPVTSITNPGVLGAEPHTPLDEAVRSPLTGLGCLAREGAVVVSEPAKRSGYALT